MPILRLSVDPLYPFWSFTCFSGDGPTAQLYGAMHGAENRVYCKPRFLDHEELAEVLLFDLPLLLLLIFHHQVYASSDVHVSASEFETLGNTVLEAFASQIPVVVPRTQVPSPRFSLP